MGIYKKQSVVDCTTVDVSILSDTQKKLCEILESDNSYDESIVDVLEAYVQEQMDKEYTDIDANLTLLKMYLIYPTQVKSSIVANVLLKGIMTMPSSYFAAATAMVSETLRQKENITAIIKAGYLLQSCLFEEFWSMDLSFADHIKGFTEAIRAYIVEAIQMNHIEISQSVLVALLNVSKDELQKITESEGWTLKEDAVQIPVNVHNQAQVNSGQENIAIQDILKVVQVLSR